MVNEETTWAITQWRRTHAGLRTRPTITLGDDGRDGGRDGGSDGGDLLVHDTVFQLPMWGKVHCEIIVIRTVDDRPVRIANYFNIMKVIEVNRILRTFFICIVAVTVQRTAAQDYQVADISCQFGGVAADGAAEASTERLSARLRKPPDFRGHPLFADDRTINPFLHPECQIRREEKEQSGLIYNLLVTNFRRCGAVTKDGYVTVRVWFPQLEGVVMATDQEVVIMCQPASPTIIQNRAAGFAGALPSQGRVSGVVEESPGRLEYEVALFRESYARTGVPDDRPLADQAVPIGSRLQLRTRINTNSAWKYAKLMSVTVSADQQDPFSPGHVELVREGCRRPEIATIVPLQPRRPEDNPGEVLLDFEAFMLDSKLAGSSRLWIHATIKACIDAADCLPEFCLDLFQPAGHGRKRRSFAGGQPPVLLEVGGDTSLSLAHVMNSRRHLPLVRIPGTTVPARYGAMHGTVHGTRPATTVSFTTVNATGSGRRITPAARTARNRQFLLQDQTTRAEAAQAAQLQRVWRSHNSTQLADNVGVTVIMPDELFVPRDLIPESCAGALVLCGVLAAAAVACAAVACCLAAKLRSYRLQQENITKLDDSPKKAKHDKSKYPSVRYLLQ
ncbi:Zona pellucida domain [Trinorchestia longiramus]|nr:Zona pellucida domain [Trinorchestia longiramus]